MSLLGEVNNNDPTIKDNDNTLLADYCRSIARAVQFPLSTVYAHALGCIAAAMNKSFFVELKGSKNPVNLYIVSSQSPSTGKSGINNYLSDSLVMAYDKLNKKSKIWTLNLKDFQNMNLYLPTQHRKQ